MDATYKRCKLTLPLFFLVICTNVGYSVVAEFIIQHEDMTSITEALRNLRKTWHKLSCDEARHSQSYYTWAHSKDDTMAHTRRPAVIS